MESFELEGWDTPKKVNKAKIGNTAKPEAPSGKEERKIKFGNDGAALPMDQLNESSPSTRKRVKDVSWLKEQVNTLYTTTPMSPAPKKRKISFEPSTQPKKVHKKNCDMLTNSG